MKQRQQQGIALITALVILALAVTLASELIQRQHLDIRLTQSLLLQQQARAYALAAESWAMNGLAKDAQNNNTDHLNELWATSLPPLPIDYGYLTGQVSDMQGRFNLNSLINAEDKPDELQQKRLRTLLQEVGGLQNNVDEAFVDWIDSNVLPIGGDGAEEDYYLRLSPAYRSPDSFFADPTELRLVRGITPEAYDALLPVIATLPESTPLNVNTAPAEALMALGMTRAQADAVISEREQDAFDDVDTFIRVPDIYDLGIEADGLSVNSNYFLIEVFVSFDTTSASLRSLIYRGDDGSTKVISRRLN